MSLTGVREPKIARLMKRWAGWLIAGGLCVLVGCVDEQAGDLHTPDSSRLQLTTSASMSPPTLARLEPIGVHAARADEPGAAEITAFDPDSARLFVTDAELGSVEVLDLRDPSAPQSIARIDFERWGGGHATSVDIADGLVAIALAAAHEQEPGTVLFLRADDLGYVNQLHVGALPDMLTFSPDQRRLVVACEGEPSDDLREDPVGTIAIIDIDERLAEANDAAVRFVGFESLEFRPLDPQIHVSPRSASVAQDLEPEYVAISADSRTAWVSLQENNALAIIDLERAQLRDVVALGERSLAAEHHGRPVFAMRQPDALARISLAGRDFVVSANEGDCRSYTGLTELAAAHGLRLDPEVFPDAAQLQRDDELGRFAVSTELGDTDHDGDYEELHACGSRSISLWTDDGQLVWDSGAMLEHLSTAALAQDELDFGPSPEGVVAAELWGRPYVFVGLERAGGIAVFDLSDPHAPRLVVYEHTTDDLGPEGLELIPAEHSPTGEPLLIAANEVSRTVRIYRIVAEPTPQR